MTEKNKEKEVNLLRLALYSLRFSFLREAAELPPRGPTGHHSQGGKRGSHQRSRIQCVWPPHQDLNEDLLCIIESEWNLQWMIVTDVVVKVLMLR